MPLAKSPHGVKFPAPRPSPISVPQPLNQARNALHIDARATRILLLHDRLQLILVDAAAVGQRMTGGMTQGRRVTKPTAESSAIGGSRQQLGKSAAGKLPATSLADDGLAAHLSTPSSSARVGEQKFRSEDRELGQLMLRCQV